MAQASRSVPKSPDTKKPKGASARKKAARRKPAASAPARRETPTRERRVAATLAPKPAPEGAPRPRKGVPAAGAGLGRRATDTPAPAPVPAEIAAETPALTEEERIESAKYLPSALRPRLFEEERFLFPDTYGVNRVRLYVKDPEWLFAHWDVSPDSLSTLRTEVGERALALSRLTLRVTDASNGGASVILLPAGVRSWYLRTAGGRRSYRAELGLTLPSGEFRGLARSNTVVAPRGAPSDEPARERRRSYKQARSLSPEAAAAAAKAQQAAEPSAEPWNVPPQDGDARIETGPGATTSARTSPGGASDVYRR